VTILPKPKNNLPYFKPKLTDSATIQKTKTPTSWTLNLPSIVDLDNDAVTLTADFGPAAKFLTLNGITSIECPDISSRTTFKAEMYLIKIMLNDKKDTVTYFFSIFVEDLPKKPSPTVSSLLASAAKNETVTA
jgi:hypothetical protein